MTKILSFALPHSFLGINGDSTLVKRVTELLLNESQMLPISKVTLTLKALQSHSSIPRSVSFSFSSVDESSLIHLLLAPVIYLPHSYFVTDHKQAWRRTNEKQKRFGLSKRTNDGK